MLQIETLENLTGFGSQNSFGEFYHSENLQPGQFGLESNISIVDDSTTGSPSRFNWYAEKQYDDSGLFAVDTSGKIFKETSGSWAVAHSPASSHGNGLISLPDGRLFYTRDDKLGIYDGTLWADSAKSFTDTVTDFAPMELYQDWVVIGNGRYIALYNINDSSFTAEGLTFPSSAVVRSIKANQTGILIGVNFATKSAILLWDAISLRSISEWLWFDSAVQSICKYGSKWIVTTKKQQYITDGYSLSPLPLPPDTIPQTDIFTCLPDATKVIDGKLFTANTTSSYNRLKSGLYIQDLSTGKFAFSTVDNGCKTDMTMGALYQDQQSRIYLSYTTNLPSSSHISQIKDQVPDFVTFVSPRLGIGTNNKTAEAIKLDLSLNPKTTSLTSSGSFDIALKIYNFKRQLWGYGVTNNVSATSSTLKVDGTQTGKNNAQVGDEVTILSGANAGLVRHISSISGQNTSSEIWTLDSALTTTTESGVYFNVQPFQLVKSKTIAITDFAELESIYFDIRNRIKGRKFLAKFVITNMTGVSIAIPSLTFVYDNLGMV